jgi:hypothetical protein
MSISLSQGFSNYTKEGFLLKPRTITCLLISTLLLFLSFFNLETTPPLWWDEGWTLQIARNWVEHGHYGRIIDGKPASARLAANVVVVTPVALSFQIFGVGIWQGRLPGVLISLTTLSLLYFLTKRLYSSRVAFGALIVLFFMSISPQVHALLVSRQVLAEMHSHFYLLAGFALFYAALKLSPWFLIPTILIWGIAIISKAQVLPFWLASLVIPLVISFIYQWRRIALMLLLALSGSYAVSYLYRWFLAILLSPITIPGEHIEGMYQLLAFVPVYDVRITALRAGFIVGLPTLLGLAYALKEVLGMLRTKQIDQNRTIMLLALISLASSWFLWYLFMANFFGRYLFPPLFFGSLFTSVLIHRLTAGFNLRYMVANASAVITRLQFNRMTIGALFAVLLMSAYIPLSLLSLHTSFNPPVKSSVQEVVAYLDAHIERGMLIETYESELLFLSDHRFHIPPDQVFVDAERRKSVDPQHPVDYNPLQADPDYLVVGAFGGGWKLYDEVISSGDFRLIQAFPRYHIHQRVR